ncbi:heme ABC transporter permease [Solimonas sp. SE-A11]|uniref:heme ABC transporter permease n=1 Tax=Solimonas sp. SE-A11 TaxID=3054954 RepID=UPI00259C6871|nr:heme ABC transporter permease [Solimonas sp. SE-A11]MDM4771744.1 heme ABC transporter permease [Solimonas sp. SE-A11]
MSSWTWFHRLASPPSFYRLADRLAPWLGWLALALLGYGWINGLFFAPEDYQQKDAYRIIYVHVPAAALSLSLYVGMAVAGFVALVWRMKLAESALIAIAPVGASFTALALVTGMLWGKPMWGAYWVWDARLTSELVLLFLYLGVIGLWQAFEDPRAAARACALLAVVGVINVPIVKYSVDWWNSLHQGSTILKMGKPSITAAMAYPLFASVIGSYLFAGYVVLRRLQNELLSREAGTAWVRELMGRSRV